MTLKFISHYPSNLASQYFQSWISIPGWQISTHTPSLSLKSLLLLKQVDPARIPVSKVSTPSNFLLLYNITKNTKIISFYVLSPSLSSSPNSSTQPTLEKAFYMNYDLSRHVSHELLILVSSMSLCFPEVVFEFLCVSAHVLFSSKYNYPCILLEPQRDLCTQKRLRKIFFAFFITCII